MIEVSCQVFSLVLALQGRTDDFGRQVTMSTVFEGYEKQYCGKFANLLDGEQKKKKISEI